MQEALLASTDGERTSKDEGEDKGNWDDNDGFQKIQIRALKFSTGSREKIFPWRGDVESLRRGWLRMGGTRPPEDHFACAKSMNTRGPRCVMIW